MDERLQVYESKMTKSFEHWEEIWQLSVQDVPIRMYWIKLK